MLFRYQTGHKQLRIKVAEKRMISLQIQGYAFRCQIITDIDACPVPDVEFTQSWITQRDIANRTPLLGTGNP